MAKRTKEIARATQNLSEALGVDICEETNLTPYEYARGGFEERKTKKTSPGWSRPNEPNASEKP